MTITETGCYWDETYLPLEIEEEEFEYSNSIFAPQLPSYWAFLSSGIDWDSQPF